MDIFLTPELKSYYLAELNKAKQIKDKDWDIDKGLIHILDEINLNPNIQTILSKRSENLNRDNVSYLHLAHTKESYHNLNNALENVKSIMMNQGTCGGDLFYLASNNYKAKTTYKGKHTLDVLSNTERYTNINCFIIEMYSFEPKDHNLFWDELLNELKNC